jgi:hypothetical protein
MYECVLNPVMFYFNVHNGLYTGLKGFMASHSLLPTHKNLD